ncbi:hypothetical protein ACWC3Y_11125 [Streptomyces sp. NPDC001296]
MNPFETPAPAPFDLTDTQKTISNALVGFVQLSLGGDAIKNDPETGRQFFEAIKDSIVAGMAACGEVKRLTEALTGLRDKHQPRPHLDPTTPGALCAACSLHGALIAWPCETWTAVDKTLAHSHH